MLTAEEKDMLNRIEGHLRKAGRDYRLGLITKAELEAKYKLVEEAEAKILAISNRED